MARYLSWKSAPTVSERTCVQDLSGHDFSSPVTFGGQCGLTFCGKTEISPLDMCCFPQTSVSCLLTPSELHKDTNSMH